MTDYSTFKVRLDSVSPARYEWPNKFFFEDRAWLPFGFGRVFKATNVKKTR